MTVPLSADRSPGSLFRPVLAAMVVASLATCVALLFKLVTFNLTMWHFMGALARIRAILQPLASIPALVRCGVWGLLFALAQRRSVWMRRAARDSLGFAGMAVVLGTMMWIGDYMLLGTMLRHAYATRFMAVFHLFFDIAPANLEGWIADVLFVGPAIVWSIGWGVPGWSEGLAADAALPAPRPAVAAASESPDRALFGISAGLILIVPSILFILWLKTSPTAGYLLILGALLGFVAAAAIVLGAALVLRGLWDYFEWPGRQWAQATPILLALAAFVIVILRPALHR